MGMYDQLLGVTQQGLNNLAQTAQIGAQQPTMADVFMDRFRQAGQDRMAQQKMQSDMAMNEAYKMSQIQQMKANEEMARRNRDIQLMDYVSKNLSGSDAYQSVVDFVTSQGGSPNLVPKLAFKTETYQRPTESEPVFPGASLAEGGEDTETYTPVETKTPVRYSDMGAAYGLKQKELDQKRELAELSMTQKSMIEQAKRERPQDPLGKLTESFLAGKIHPDDYFAMKRKMLFIPNPAAGPAASSGFQIAPGLNGSGSTPEQWSSQQPLLAGQGAAPLAGQAGTGAQQAATPRQQKGSGALPKATNANPLPKTVVLDAEEQGALQEYTAAVDEQIDRLEKLKKHPGIKYGTGIIGMAGRNVPDTDAYAFNNALKSATASKVIQTIMKMKQASKNGSTGFGALSEPENQRLIDADVSLDPRLNPEDFAKKVDEYIALLKDQKTRATAKQTGVSEARNLPKKKKPISLDEYFASKEK